MGRTERRRSLIVDRPIQRRIVVAVALFPTASLAVAAMIVAVFSRRLAGEAAVAQAELPSLLPLLLSLLGFTLLSVAIVLHQAVRFSHRIAGPSYNLLRSFERVRNGDLAFRVRLRDGDHLTELADGFNDMLDWLAEHPPKGVQPAGGSTATVEAVRDAEPIAPAAR